MKNTSFLFRFFSVFDWKTYDKKQSLCLSLSLDCQLKIEGINVTGIYYACLPGNIILFTDTFSCIYSCSSLSLWFYFALYTQRLLFSQLYLQSNWRACMKSIWEHQSWHRISTGFSFGLWLRNSTRGIINIGYNC